MRRLQIREACALFSDGRRVSFIFHPTSQLLPLHPSEIEA